MQFTCQRTGKCCTHPNIVVTLTHDDLWVLFQQVQNIEDLKKLVQFILLKPEKQQEKLVLTSIRTTIGEGVFILRKNTDQKCIFYTDETSSCEIHAARPQACRNFPFSFSEKKNELAITLVKGANNFCMGIGKGRDYGKEELAIIGNHTLEIFKEYNNIVTEINKEASQEQPLTPQDALMTLVLVAQQKRSKKEQKYEIL